MGKKDKEHKARVQKRNDNIKQKKNKIKNLQKKIYEGLKELNSEENIIIEKPMEVRVGKKYYFKGNPNGENYIKR